MCVRKEVNGKNLKNRRLGEEGKAFQSGDVLNRKDRTSRVSLLLKMNGEMRKLFDSRVFLTTEAGSINEEVSALNFDEICKVAIV